MGLGNEKDKDGKIASQDEFETLPKSLIWGNMLHKRPAEMQPDLKITRCQICVRV